MVCLPFKRPLDYFLGDASILASRSLGVVRDFLQGILIMLAIYKTYERAATGHSEFTLV